MSRHEKLMDCPKCGKHKFYYNTLKEKGYCHSGSCNYAVSNNHNTRKFFAPNIPIEALQKLEERVKMRNLTELQEIDYNQKSGNPKVWDFLKSRGCHNNVKSSVYRYRAWFPLRLGNSVGVVDAFMGRTLIDEKPKWLYKGPKELKSQVYYCPFPERMEDSLTTAIVIVEGIFDALVKFTAVSGNICMLSILGTTLSDSLGGFIASKKCPVVVWLDWDDAGREATPKIVEKLKNLGVARVATVSCGYEPSECPPEILRKELQDITDWTLQRAKTTADC